MVVVLKVTHLHALIHQHQEVKIILDHILQVDPLEAKEDLRVVRVDLRVHVAEEDSLIQFPFFTVFNYNINIT